MRIRRELAGLGVLAAFWTVWAAGAGEQEKVELVEKARVDDQCRVEMDLKLSGQIHIKNGDKTVSLKLAATAEHRFPERVLAVDADGKPAQAAPATTTRPRPRSAFRARAAGERCGPTPLARGPTPAKRNGRLLALGTAHARRAQADRRAPRPADVDRPVARQARGGGRKLAGPNAAARRSRPTTAWSATSFAASSPSSTRSRRESPSPVHSMASRAGRK